jgi:hypothetical protein
LKEPIVNGLGPNFEVEHGDFAWQPDGSLAMKFRLRVPQGTQKAEIWVVEFSYPAEEATALQPKASPEERAWFSLMIKTRVNEWWNGGPSVMTSTRLVKRQH